METKQAIKTMFQASGAKLQNVAAFLGVKQPTFSLWLNKLDQVKRLIKVCEFCGCDLIITDHQNINIKLTIEKQNK